MFEKFEDKTVFVTGCCGTIGSELVRILLSKTNAKIIGIDNNENEIFFQQQELSFEDRYRSFHLDIRDLNDLKMRMQGSDMVIHTAAMKHVGVSENSPNQAIASNINGTQNIISAAVHNRVERVLFTSSDKAVNPTNVMGTTKLMGERLITAANSSYPGTIFASTRFGNVLGSRGSVVPIFKGLLAAKKNLTVTDPEMTRFIMTLSDAAELVLESLLTARGGEVFVLQMPVAKILNIAEIMIMQANLENELRIEIIGAKPAEKLYEELMNDEELRRSYMLDDFIVIIPAHETLDSPAYNYLRNAPKATNVYNSSNETALCTKELEGYLINNSII